MGNESRHPPRKLLVLFIALIMITLMAWLRFVAYPNAVVPLAYSLPLLLTLWHRDRRIHWGMAAIFVGMSAYKTFVILPKAELAYGTRWAFEGMDFANILIVALVVDYINWMRDRINADRSALQDSNARLEAANAEIVTREEEISRQNEGLNQQAKELAAQAEELRTANGEITRREATLRSLLDVSGTVGDAEEMIRRVCSFATQFIDGTIAAVVWEKQGRKVVVRAQEGLGTRPGSLTLPLDRTLAAVVMARGEGGFLEDVALRPDLVFPQPLADSAIRAALAAPVRIHGEMLGALEVYSTETRRWSAEQKRLLEWLAEQCSTIWEIMRLRREQRRAEDDLRRANDELEQRVRQRTEELEAANQRLHRASLYTRGLIEASLDPLVTIGPDGKITDVNHATEEVTGVSREKLIGSDFSEYFTEPQKAVEGYRAVFSEGLVRDYPLTVRHASGRTTDVLYHAIVYRDEAGKVQGVFAAARDITERKKLEEQLYRASRYTRGLIEASLDPLVTIGPDGKITDVNRATEEVTGVIRGRLIGSDFSDYFTEPQEAVAGYQEAFSKGLVRDYPLTIRHASGRTTHVLYNAIVYRDEAGEMQGVFAAARDITERHQAEEALKAERQRFNDVLEMLPVFVTLLTPDYHMPFANRFYRGRFGESDGKRCFEHLFGRSEPCEVCDAFKALRTNAPQESEWTGPDGRNYDVFSYPFVDTDGSSRILEMGIDITERKCAEEQLRAVNAELEQRAQQLRALASELSKAEDRERRRLAQILHDHLQQLLVSANFSVASVLRSTEDAKVREGLEEVKNLVTRAIDASRSLTAELSPPILYDSGLAGALCWLARWMKEKHGQEIDLHLDDEVDAPHDTRSVLFQSTRELLFNVVKHSGVNRAKVSLEEWGSGQLRLVVADEGAGFNVAREVERQRAAGGFGLFNIRERLECLGGHLEVHSVPGHGTRMTMFAPKAHQPQMGTIALAAEVPKSPAKSPATPALPMRVMLVDDHRIMREGLAQLLGEVPDIKIVGEAEDGQQAVELARQLHPDVVIMDVAMPRMNGIDATRILVAERPQCRVIALSMHQQADMAAAMRQAGAVLYLPKDGPAETLIAAIRGASGADLAGE